ncbi:MAG: 50S ribosomal protein L17 [Candidatus Omnitrophota bacterium]|nr:50S ribosomal protein L17 [Candidatus Omnitrophota bacterium]
MRHAERSQRLSRPSHQREALLEGLVQNLIVHEQIKTTHARAKEAQRLADRLVRLGKEGSIASRRRALRVLQDRTLVKRLFTDIAPRFVDVQSGYTRVLRLSTRRGDGAQRSLLAFSRLPAIQPAAPGMLKPQQAPKAPKTPAPLPRPVPPKAKEEVQKPKGFLGGLRRLWTRKKPG